MTKNEISAAKAALRTTKPASSGFSNWMLEKEFEMRKAKQDHEAKRIVMFAQMLADGYTIPEKYMASVDAYLSNLKPE